MPIYTWPLQRYWPECIRACVSRVDPGPAVSGDGYRESHAQPLPLNWYAALEAFERSAFVSEYLGEGFKRVFLAIKREELSRFFAEVTELDYAWYMRHA